MTDSNQYMKFKCLKCGKEYNGRPVGYCSCQGQICTEREYYEYHNRNVIPSKTTMEAREKVEAEVESWRGWHPRNRFYIERR
jgi:hypothetical protein